MRPRACGAVIVGEQILMVRHIHDGRDYWTLPGGGIESGETASEAATREVLEETGLNLTVDRFLFTTCTSMTETHCFLMISPGMTDEVELGSDPEEIHLAPEERMLRAAEWHSIESMKNDIQVSRVIHALQKGTGAKPAV